MFLVGGISVHNAVRIMRDDLPQAVADQRIMLRGCRAHIALHSCSLLSEIGIATTTVATWRQSAQAEARGIGSFGGGSATSAYLFFAFSLLSTLFSFVISAFGVQGVFTFIASAVRSKRDSRTRNARLAEYEREITRVFTHERADTPAAALAVIGVASFPPSFNALYSVARGKSVAPTEEECKQQMKLGRGSGLGSAPEQKQPE